MASLSGRSSIRTWSGVKSESPVQSSHTLSGSAGLIKNTGAPSLTACSTIRAVPPIPAASRLVPDRDQEVRTWPSMTRPAAS